MQINIFGVQTVKRILCRHPNQARWSQGIRIGDTSRDVIKGAESRDKLSFDECTVLIEDSDTENHGNNQQDASYKDEVYSNELHAHYTDIVIENGTSGDSKSQPVNTDLGPDVSEAEPVEMFVPSLVIHIIPEAKQTTWPSWKNLNWLHRADASHRAILRHRESCKDISGLYILPISRHAFSKDATSP